MRWLRVGLVAVLACGDNFPGQPDASSDLDGDASGRCDPLLQNCPSGEACYWADLGEFRCSPAGGLPLYHPCRAVAQCSPGDGCHLDDRLDFYCTAYCDYLNLGGEADPRCESHELCASWDGAIGICIGICDPRQQACPEGQGCYAIEGGADLCFPVAVGAEVGQACVRQNDCIAGAQCVEDVCRRLCDYEQFPGAFDPVCQPAQTCTGPSGSPEIGYCL
jgi:hypothetical protein